MNRIIPVFCLAVGSSFCAKSQLYIDNATFFIEPGATVTVQGDLTSNTNIQGTGKILLKGTALQNVNMNSGGAATNAFTIPNLEIDNTSNVALTGNLRVGNAVLFTNGKVQAGNFNFTLANAATTTGMADGKFIETNGTGMVQREIGNAAASNVLLPVGAGTAYTPVSLTHTGGTYTNAVLSAQAKAGKSPNAPIRSESFTNVYWPLSTTGVTGGTFIGTGTYTAIAAMAGATATETDVYGMSYNGSVWSRTGGTQNYTAKTISAQLAGNSGQLFGMNRFLLLNSRVLLQGASPSAGIMNDGLRIGTNVIPTTEPYRAITGFTSLDGGVQEVAASSIFADQANTNNNLVDWVFVELRNNATSGSTMLQTRSAFVQKDGDVVDIDGTTPVYFKNLDANDFTVTIRHRNHLAISTNNAGGIFKSLAIAPSASLDFSTLAAGSILGTANTNYANVGGFNMLVGGNANGTLGTPVQRVTYSGSGNDPAYVLSTILGGNASNNTVINVYSPGDVNMNKRVTYSGSNNDAAFILATPLQGSASSIKTQILPN